MLQLLIVIFVIVFGLITSQEDFLHNRIRNRWILFALVFGVVTSTVIYIGHPGLKVLQFPFLGEFWLNALFVFCSGWIMWYSGIWSAGDAKLFLAYGFIIPPSFYKVGYIPHFPAFSLIVNTFTPFLLFFVFYVLIKSPRSKLKQVAKMAFNWRLVLNLLLFVFSFGWLIQLIFKPLGINLNFIIVVVFLFLIIMFATRYLKLRLLPFNIIISIIRVVLTWRELANGDFIVSLVIMLFVLLILRYYLLTLSYELFSKPVYIENLRGGMIPAEDIYKLKPSSYSKRKFAFFSFIGAMLRRSTGNSIFSSLGDGMTHQEAALVKTLHSKGFFKPHIIRIYDALPFAPFMFLGALITLATGTDIVTYIFMLIETFI